VSFFDQSESVVKQNQSKNITFHAIGNCPKERKKELSLSLPGIISRRRRRRRHHHHHHHHHHVY